MIEDTKIILQKIEHLYKLNPIRSIQIEMIENTKKSLQEFDVIKDYLDLLIKRLNSLSGTHGFEAILILIYIRFLLMTLAEILEDVDELILNVVQSYDKLIPEEKWKEYE